jgi:hypothetical protein
MAEPEKKETWFQWVALTTTVLAVAAAISSLRASSYSTKVQIHTTKEANQWAYFQSKSIKEHNFTLTRDLLAAIGRLEKQSPGLQEFLQPKIKEYDREIVRYEREKKEIKTAAEKLIQEQEVLKSHNASFATAVMLLQIAIMLSAIAALIKRKLLWVIGVLMGVSGITYMLNGFYLWF